ncbi:hypothetical protein [Aestuariivirga sp.]|uniref:hypothetical protein n=1 Tax=Aestuariivirga sp. TaxID=2650926 RepID=UPI00301ACDA3
MAKTPTAPPARTESLKERAIAEMKIYLAVTLYLWVLLALFALYKRALLNENGIDYWRQGSAIVNALILGKVLLIGEILKLGDGLRKRALVWVVLGKAALFTALLMLFHVVEEVIRALIKGLPFAESILSIGGGSWFGVFVYAAVMFVMLMPLAAFCELSFVLGSGAMWRLMTGSETKSGL